MVRLLRRRVFAALGLAPALSLAACTNAKTADDDDDDDVDDTGYWAPTDADGDGYAKADDCDDEDPEVHPGAEEQCNDQDDDCDGAIDEDLPVSTWWADQDGDGWGGDSASIEACGYPAGYSSDNIDCDDTDANVHPGAEEQCNGVDDDCDGSVDIGTIYVDEDGDGYGGTPDTWALCEPLPEGASERREDCDDDAAEISPDAIEVCWDRTDNDCDGRRSCFDISAVSETEECASSWSATWLYTESPEVCSDCDFELYAEFSPTQQSSTSDTCAEAVDATSWDVAFHGGLIPLDSSWEIVSEGWEDDLFRLEARTTYEDAGVEWTETFRFELDQDEVEVYEYYGYEGRPFTVSGAPRFAIPTATGGWTDPTAAHAADLPPAVRARVAAVWSAAGRAEHASVASFARFALELMALGAPAELLAECSQAMADEVAHAQACFGVAAAFGGEERGVGPLDVAGSLAAAGNPEATLVALIREGCVGETVSAARAGRALAGTRDPEIRKALAKIVADEGRHAAFAWRSAMWLLGEHPALRSVARDTFAAAMAANATAQAKTATVATQAAAVNLAHFGVLDAAARQAVRAETWREVVEPAAAILIGAERVAYA
jgi:hypothetical protein